MKAAYRNRKEIVKFCIEQKANILGFVDVNGFNAFIWACMGGAFESLLLLVEACGNATGLKSVINKIYGNDSI